MERRNEDRGGGEEPNALRKKTVDSAKNERGNPVIIRDRGPDRHEKTGFRIAHHERGKGTTPVQRGGRRRKGVAGLGKSSRPKL